MENDRFESVLGIVGLIICLGFAIGLGMFGIIFPMTMEIDRQIQIFLALLFPILPFSIAVILIIAIINIIRELRQNKI